MSRAKQNSIVVYHMYVYMRGVYPFMPLASMYGERGIRLPHDMACFTHGQGLLGGWKIALAVC
jgi:hypothetical protein